MGKFKYIRADEHAKIVLAADKNGRKYGKAIGYKSGHRSGLLHGVVMAAAAFFLGFGAYYAFLVP